MIGATRQRILRATTANLSWQPQGADGDPADPGTVTVSVTTSDGTELAAAGTATVGSGSNPRTVELTVAQTAALDVLTATWKVGSTTVATTKHDIVGGFYFTVAEFRGREPSAGDAGRDDLAAVKQARAEVEALFESACGMAFVPRFDVDHIRNVGWEIPLRPWVRNVRWVRVWYGTGLTDYSTLTTSQIAALAPLDSGVIHLRDYSAEGATVEIGYEHGLDAPPFDVKREAMVAVRAQLHRTTGGTPDRATSMQLGDGTSVTLATPGVGHWHTGIPSVDEVLRRYNHIAPSIG